MANVQLFDGLAPVELLELMARLARDHAEHLAVLRRVQVLFEPGSATLIVPITTPLESEHVSYERLKAEYRGTPGAVAQPREEPSPPGAHSLSDALVLALLTSRDEKHPAEPEDDEFLLVAPNLSQEQAGDLLQLVRGNATEVRLASAQNAAKQRVWIYHVLSDQLRRSTFLGAYTGGVFGACQLYGCYHFGQSREARKVFLSMADDKGLGADALRNFCDIVERAPGFFGFHRDDVSRRRHGLLAAVEDTGDDRFRLFHLARLYFRTWEEIAASPPEHASVEFFDLRASEEEMPRLRERMRQTEPFIGYRLQLMPTNFPGDAQMEQQRIQERMIELEERLAGLASLNEPRPLLIRFDQRQLPALADVLRRYPTDVLRSGELRYGFQANADHPLGQHYIYADPHAPQAAISALCAWADHEPPVMRFWLDPYWARHYHDGGNHALIFVPEGDALYPTLHSWEPAEMDAYLTAMMDDWYANQDGNQNGRQRLDVLEHPVFVFEPARAYGDLHISVLDLASFRPLKTQLSWLNDNLLVYDDLKSEELIQELADASARVRLAKQYTEWADDAEATYAAVAQTLQETLTAKTTALTEAMTSELDDLFDSVAETVDEIDAQQARLETLRRWAAEMRSTASRLEALRDQVGAEVQATEADTAALQKRAKKALQEASSERARIEREIEVEVRRLRQAEIDLLTRLDELQPTPPPPPIDPSIYRDEHHRERDRHD